MEKEEHTTSGIPEKFADLLENFNLVPKDEITHESEYNYRLFMIQLLENLLKEQRQKLTELEGGKREDMGVVLKNVQENRLEGFNSEWPWVDQCIFFIKREGKPLLLNQIVRCMAEVYEEARVNPVYFGNSLSASLSNAIKRGRIRRHSLPKKRAGWYYPNSWADKNGDLLKRYQDLVD